MWGEVDPQRNFSAAIVRNTGFGVLEIKREKEDSLPYNVTYEHISALNCTRKDSFVMLSSLNGSTSDDSSVSKAETFLAVLALLIIIGTILIILGLYCYRKKKRSSSNR